MRSYGQTHQHRPGGVEERQRMLVKDDDQGHLDHLGSGILSSTPSVLSQLETDEFTVHAKGNW
jgi:hypothetical protein